MTNTTGQNRVLALLGRLLRLRCGADGGTMPDGRHRSCTKYRWHTDSHTYEFEAKR